MFKWIECKKSHPMETPLMKSHRIIVTYVKMNYIIVNHANLESILYTIWINYIHIFFFKITI